MQRWSSRESLGVFALSPGRVQKSSEKCTSGLTQSTNSEHTQSMVSICVIVILHLVGILLGKVFCVASVNTCGLAVGHFYGDQFFTVPLHTKLMKKFAIVEMEDT